MNELIIMLYMLCNIAKQNNLQLNAETTAICQQYTMPTMVIENIVEVIEKKVEPPKYTLPDYCSEPETKSFCA